MKITVKGEMTFRQVIQALYEALHQIEHDHAFRHSRGVTLYINPTDGEGNTVVPHTKAGDAVTSFSSGGPYRSAADRYEP